MIGFQDWKQGRMTILANPLRSLNFSLASGRCCDVPFHQSPCGGTSMTFLSILKRDAQAASRAGKLLDLTPREFDLLAYLICHAGEAVGREELAREVWREPSRFTP